MTEEINKLIESVETLRLEHSSYDSLRGMSSVGFIDVVRKSDFDRIVSELTTWNKVEEKLPESEQILTDVLVKIKGKRLQCNLGIVAATFDRRTGKFNTSEKCVEVTEWRYIH